MDRKNRPVSIALLYFALITAPLTLLFQNCSEAPHTDESGNASLGAVESMELTLRNELGQNVAPGESLLVGQGYELSVNESLIDTAVPMQWSLVSSVAGACHLHDVVAGPLKRELHCDGAADVGITVTGQLLAGDKSFKGTVQLHVQGSSLSTPTPTPTPGPSATPAPSANIVNFTIPAGTGNKPYNTLAAAVRVFVGQTLRITNSDTVPHRLHTSNNAPCPHQPTNTVPGGSFDCIVGRPVLAAAGSTYDHISGTAAKFYINSYDGNALYANRCAGCHNPLATSTRKGRTAQQIRTAILNVPNMQAIQLTDDEVAAIAYTLSR